jgi:hypothetical protein
MQIEQALYGTRSPGGYGFLGQSPGFREEWLEDAERLCTGFGERPAGATCPLAVFALPLVKGQIAVVQVADQGYDDAGRPGALAFRILAVPEQLYYGLQGDPFAISDCLPPVWDVRTTLPTLDWAHGPPPPRDVADLQKVLNVQQSAFLLGSVQALVDGGRIAIERKAPAPEVVRAVWALLPTNQRCELWPASFAFSNQHGFHLIVTPRADGPDYGGYVFEEQAGDYPEGRFEYALQHAIESGDQRELDRLLSRRSRSQTLRLALILLAMFMFLPILSALFQPRQPARPPEEKKVPEKEKAPESGGKARSQQPPLPTHVQLEDPPQFADEHYPDLDHWEQEELARHLRGWGERLGLPLQGGTSASDVTLGLEGLDRHLGTPDPTRDLRKWTAPLQAVSTVGRLASPNPQCPLFASQSLMVSMTGELRDMGPIQKQLRLLLWKHRVADYGIQGPNTIELLEMLEAKAGRGR